MAKGILEGWLDGIVEKATKIIAEEAVPALVRVDQVLDEVERQAEQIKRRSEVLVAEGEAQKLEADKRKAHVIDAEFTETEPEKKAEGK